MSRSPEQRAVHRAREALRRARDPEYRARAQAITRAWTRNNPARVREYSLKRYGITSIDYERMLEAQGGCCAICRSTTPGGNRKRFCVDHDHQNGRVRGLLCLRCNSSLGALGDNISGVSRALTYLAPLVANVDEHW